MTEEGIRPDDEVARLLVDFGIHQARRNLSPLTVLHRRLRVEAFAGWLEARGSHLFAATADDVELWLDASPLAPQTRYTYVAYLASFYTWAMKAGHTTTDPTETIDRPKLPIHLPRPLASTSLQDAIRYANPRMRAWLHLGAYQGFRCIEIVRLRGEDVDPNRLTITARGKGNKERTIALHPETLASLRAYGLPERGLVFERRGGGPVQPSTVSRYISRHLADAGTAHQLRHWFGTEVYEGSRDLLLTQQLLGHASPATTAVYAQVSGERGRSVIGGLGGGGGGGGQGDGTRVIDGRAPAA